MVTYLDNAGATIPSSSMLSLIFDDISKLPLGNPHSQRSTSLMIDSIRSMILEYYGVSNDQYDVIFTSGATASCKLVAETFPFGDNGVFAYSSNAHTSLLGMRAYANNAFNIPFDKLIDYESPSETITNQTNDNNVNNDNNDNSYYNLLALSGECNFSGAKLDFNSIHKKMKDLKGTNWLTRDLSADIIKSSNTEVINDKKWLLFLDAAKLSSTSPVNFNSIPSSQLPHFIAVSFYKMFGYPTGLGALLIRRDTADVLQKRYFGGGTVLAASADIDYTIPKYINPHDQFEDGTSHFYGIVALRRGFEYLQSIGGMIAVQNHTMSLCKHTIAMMRLLIHEQSGNPLVQIYGRHLDDFDDIRYNEIQGPIIAFNLFWSNGDVIGFSDVATLAEKEGIILRSGCFCNVGACSSALKLTPADIQRNFALGRTCEDTTIDIVDGRATGAVRISFGYNNTIDDCAHFLKFLKENFLNQSPKYCSSSSSLPYVDVTATNDTIILKDIYLYPIKSCGGMQVKRWPLSPTGLLLDREWALVDSNSVVLTQKKFPSLSLLKATIDLNKRYLTISYDKSSNIINNTSITIPINGLSDDDNQQSVRVCGRHCNAAKSSTEVNRWFSDYLGTPCSLVRISNLGNAIDKHRDREDKDTKISFSNDAPFLIVSAESLMTLASQVDSLNHLSDDRRYIHSIESIRPNFVVTGGNKEAHQEDHWSTIVITPVNNEDSIYLKLIGPCPRCSMVNINNNTGKYESGILEAMSAYRTKQDKRVYFGQFASYGSNTIQKMNEKDTIHIEVNSNVLRVV